MYNVNNLIDLAINKIPKLPKNYLAIYGNAHISDPELVANDIIRCNSRSNYFNSKQVFRRHLNGYANCNNFYMLKLKLILIVTEATYNLIPLKTMVNISNIIVA